MQKEKMSTPASNAPAGVAFNQLDELKAKYKNLNIITIKKSKNETVTGYFKKPDRSIMLHCVNLNEDGKKVEAMEYLFNQTFVGGDDLIKTDEEISLVAQLKLWSLTNFLTASSQKY